MEHHENTSDDQRPYHHVPTYQANQIPRSIIPSPHQYLTNPPHQTQPDHQLRQFWAKQSEEAFLTTDFRTHALPLARIRRIMKSNEEVKMIAFEAPILLAKACEMFILDLTLRSWSNTEENRRRILQRHDVISALDKTDLFDFLVDFIHGDEFKEEEVESKPRGGDCTQFPTEGASYYYMPPPPPPPPPTPPYVGNPVDSVHQMAPVYMTHPMWPQPPSPPSPPPLPSYDAGSYKYG